MKKIFILLAFIATLNLSIMQIDGASSSQRQIDNPDLNRELIEAIRNDNINEVQRLIDAGANVNALDRYGNTFLHEAIENENIDIAQLLIDAGADLNALDSVNNNTPLHYAAILGHVDTAQLLINAGANINALNAEGYTPLHETASEGSTSAIARALIERNANINIQSAENKTPIGLAQGETKQLLENIVNVEQQLEKIIPGGPIKPILDKYDADFKKSIIKRLIFKEDESFEKDRFDLVARAEKAYPELEINVLLKEIIERNPGIYKEYKEFSAQEKMRKQLLKEQHQGSFADVEIAREPEEEEISTNQKSEKKSNILSRKRKRE